MNPLHKNIFVSALALLSSFCLAPGSLAGGRDQAGNGGDFIVCAQANGKTQTESLDLFEAKNIYKREIEIGQSSKMDGMLEYILLRLRVLAPGFADKIDARLNQFEGDSILVDDDLTYLPDSGEVALPLNCKLGQGIIRIPSRLPFGKQYVIQRKVWETLDEQNRTALKLHELIYGFAFDELGHRDSKISRILVGALMSDQMAALTPADLDDILKKLGFPSGKPQTEQTNTLIFKEPMCLNVGGLGTPLIFSAGEQTFTYAQNVFIKKVNVEDQTVMLSKLLIDVTASPTETLTLRLSGEILWQPWGSSSIRSGKYLFNNFGLEKSPDEGPFVFELRENNYDSDNAELKIGRQSTCMLKNVSFEIARGAKPMLYPQEGFATDDTDCLMTIEFGPKENRMFVKAKIRQFIKSEQYVLAQSQIMELHSALESLMKGAKELTFNFVAQTLSGQFTGPGEANSFQFLDGTTWSFSSRPHVILDLQKEAAFILLQPRDILATPDGRKIEILKPTNLELHWEKIGARFGWSPAPLQSRIDQAFTTDGQMVMILGQRIPLPKYYNAARYGGPTWTSDQLVDQNSKHLSLTKLNLDLKLDFKSISCEEGGFLNCEDTGNFVFEQIEISGDAVRGQKVTLQAHQGRFGRNAFSFVEDGGYGDFGSDLPGMLNGFAGRISHVIFEENQVRISASYPQLPFRDLAPRLIEKSGDTLYQVIKSNALSHALSEDVLVWSPGGLKYNTGVCTQWSTVGDSQWKMKFTPEGAAKFGRAHMNTNIGPLRVREFDLEFCLGPNGIMLQSVEPHKKD